MKVEEAFNEAFSYTKNFVGDVGRLIILAILGIIPIINFIVLGYACKVVRQTPASNTPPKLEEFLNMWVDGLKIVIVGITYMIIPLLLAVFAGVLTATGFIGYHFIIFSFIRTTTFIISLILGFILSIFLVIGVIHMIKTDNFSKAFAIGEILNVIGRVGWDKYIIWLIVIFVFEVIISVIGSIPFIGWVILMFTIPVFVVFAARSITMLYSEVQQEAIKITI